MNNVLKFTLRPSDVVLDRVYNPTRSADFSDATPSQLAEACGLIPDFFAAACVRPLKLTLDNIADGMDDAYQYGGFSAYPSPAALPISVFIKATTAMTICRHWFGLFLMVSSALFTSTP